MQKMEMIIQKSHYKMKNILITLFVLLYVSCKKNNTEFENHVIAIKTISAKKDSLITIKDTVLFVNSSEGEDVKAFINKTTNDTIIKSEVFGEMGKSEYTFVYNKTLKKGECLTYRYNKPIYINSNPEIKQTKKEDLQSSKASSERLSGIFQSYKKVLFLKKLPLTLNENWVGKYHLILNEDSEDWRNIREIKIDISKDSVTYLAKGYQLYQYYTLSADEKGYSLILKYDTSLDNTDSWALQKTKDFGVITFDGKTYKWESPYIDENFSDGKKSNYILKKEK